MKKRKWNRGIINAAVAGVLGCCGAVNAAMIYTVNGSGVIHSYSGAASGINPIEDNTFSGGTTETTVAAYGSYLGFTQAPDGKVYGVNASGGVDRWDTLDSWLAGDTAVAESSGVYGAGGIHGCSYDGFSGGFYVVYEGGDLEGDIGKYASLDDFIHNRNASVSPSGYGGNIFNFYYPDSDSSAGSRYWQASGGGDLEDGKHWHPISAVLRTGPIFRRMADLQCRQCVCCDGGCCSVAGAGDAGGLPDEWACAPGVAGGNRSGKLCRVSFFHARKLWFAVTDRHKQLLF